MIFDTRYPIKLAYVYLFRTSVEENMSIYSKDPHPHWSHITLNMCSVFQKFQENNDIFS